MIIDSKKICYLGYYEIFKDEDITTYVKNKIPSKSTSIYIIGHSLGGWNGAHLTSKLSSSGYNVKMLITLDPVGKGVILGSIADIYWKEPTVTADIWINIHCKPEDYSFSDFVADLGEQWSPEEDEPTYNIVTPEQHLDADLILKTEVIGRATGLDLLIQSIKESLRC